MSNHDLLGSSFEYPPFLFQVLEKIKEFYFKMAQTLPSGAFSIEVPDHEYRQIFTYHFWFQRTHQLILKRQNADLGQDFSANLRAMNVTGKVRTLKK